jgi:5'-3' exonuclease
MTRSRDENGVVKRFGVSPASIPDYLALTGDSSDGFPGLSGWGPKSAAAVLHRFQHIEAIPDDWREWKIVLRGADRLSRTLEENRELALLFKDLATLRIDAPLFDSIDELRWTGPSPGFATLCDALDAPELSVRAASLASSSRA